jgi:hypothetical protein
MRRASALRQRFTRTPAKSNRGASPFVLNFLQFHGLCPVAGDDDQVDTVRQHLRRKTEALAAKALDAIASHGPADLATHDQADAGPLVYGLRLGP